jgi:hypothetical protein
LSLSDEVEEEESPPLSQGKEDGMGDDDQTGIDDGIDDEGFFSIDDDDEDIGMDDAVVAEAGMWFADAIWTGLDDGMDVKR